MCEAIRVPKHRPHDWLVATHVAPAGSTIILTLTSTFLVLGLIALVFWRLTGNVAWVERFFTVPGAMGLVLLAAFELTMCLRVVREFSKGEALHDAWQLLGISSGCNLIGSLMAQVLSTDSVLNPLHHLGWWSASTGTMMRTGGLALGGPCRFAFLAAGLFAVLRVYQKSGLLARLARVDWALLALVGLYIAVEARDTVAALQLGKHPTRAEEFGWPVDPLLWMLLAEGLLLYRTVKKMGQGWIGRCWQVMSVGIFLVTLGDVAIWATSYGFLPWPWSSLGWYIWIPAAGAFALAPTYQLEAMWQARMARSPRNLESI